MDIARGNEYVSSTLRDRIADQEAMVRAVPGAESQPLTPREHEVAELTVDGYTIKATASKLGIRNSTVVTHRTRIMEKLRAASAVEVAQSLHGQEIDMYRHHLRFEWPCKKCRENPQACCRGKWGEG